MKHSTTKIANEYYRIDSIKHIQYLIVFYMYRFKLKLNWRSFQLITFRKKAAIHIKFTKLFILVH